MVHLAAVAPPTAHPTTAWQWPAYPSIRATDLAHQNSWLGPLPELRCGVWTVEGQSEVQLPELTVLATAAGTEVPLGRCSTLHLFSCVSSQLYVYSSAVDVWSARGFEALHVALPQELNLVSTSAWLPTQPASTM